MIDIKESDWKLLRQLKPVALDRFCSRILSEVGQASSDHAKALHDRYLTVYRLMQDRDYELGQMFNDLKRSNAVDRLYLLRRKGLLTDDEWDNFSDEIKRVFAQIQNI